MLRTRIFDIESLDSHGAVPVAPVHSTERPHANILPVKLDVLGGDLPVFDGFFGNVFHFFCC